ncbi:hypothetical protein PSCLAVI8L_90126 [Pseudoclavibacter sp. 8L]|nr:hypothetical protein PSCLAVI8L_90126 [Pseudoclavibacter sp. 8L]
MSREAGSHQPRWTRSLHLSPRGPVLLGYRPRDLQAYRPTGPLTAAPTVAAGQTADGTLSFDYSVHRYVLLLLLFPVVARPHSS